MNLAVKHDLRSISFPALSTGYFGYPLRDAASIALETVVEELLKLCKLELVRFVLFDLKILEIHEKILDSIIKCKNIE